VSAGEPTASIDNQPTYRPARLLEEEIIDVTQLPVLRLDFAAVDV